MKDKEIYILGEKILTYLKKHLQGSYYQEHNNPDELTLVIDENFSLTLCEWSNKKYYLILYYKTNYKWELFLKRIVQIDGKISCYLAKPRNTLNTKVYEDYFGNYSVIPAEISTQLIKQYKNLTDKKGCLLADATSEDMFFSNYLKLLKVIMHAHENELLEEERVFEPNYGEGTISKKASAPTRISISHKEYSDVHQQLQRKILEKYSADGWKVNVEASHRNDSSRIDAVAIKKNEKYYFEVKPYFSARECIREALGQLLEYWYYKKTSSYEKATKLIIVGPEKCKKVDDEFLEQLRSLHKLPIEYEHFSIDED